MLQYRKTPRARFLDYDCGDFFVTICTKDRKHYFGEIYNGSMSESELGAFAKKQLLCGHKFLRGIDVLEFVVMPNHIHMIIRIDRNVGVSCSGGSFGLRNPNPALRVNAEEQRYVPFLSRYIASFKGVVTKYARKIGTEFSWQSRYHDHAIRGVVDGNNIGEYIRNNVMNWSKDCFFDS